MKTVVKNQKAHVFLEDWYQFQSGIFLKTKMVFDRPRNMFQDDLEQT